jgi:hypothetical protein
MAVFCLGQRGATQPVTGLRFADVPAGWRTAYGEADRAGCLDYIEQNWTDIG